MGGHQPGVGRGHEGRGARRPGEASHRSRRPVGTGGRGAGGTDDQTEPRDHGGGCGPCGTRKRALHPWRRARPSYVTARRKQRHVVATSSTLGRIWSKREQRGRRLAASGSAVLAAAELGAKARGTS